MDGVHLYEIFFSRLTIEVRIVAGFTTTGLAAFFIIVITTATTSIVITT
jgi:hypothetical protein